MKYGVLDRLAHFQMLDNNSLEQLGCNLCIPYSFRVHDNDGTSCTNPEAWCFTSLHPGRSEKQAFALKQ